MDQITAVCGIHCQIPAIRLWLYYSIMNKGCMGKWLDLGYSKLFR